MRRSRRLAVAQDIIFVLGVNVAGAIVLGVFATKNQIIPYYHGRS